MNNTAVLFVQNTEALLDCGTAEHIADKITKLTLKKQFPKRDAAAIVYDVLINHWKYASVSFNLPSPIADTEACISQLAKLKAADIVILYHHPDLGVLVINPKNPEHKEYLDEFRKNELVVIYAGYAGKKDADAAAELALKKCTELLSGKKTVFPESLLKGSFGYKKPKETASTKKRKTSAAGKTAAKTSARKNPPEQTKRGTFSFGEKPAAQMAKQNQSVHVQADNPASLKKMTPMLSVPVTNELFHNGNVEAWKRIIASYTAKYPGLQIFVYYDGERITDINALFKWGKVKHGSSIQFVVAGDDIKDVAKLKRYFTQGASPMFEAFLQGAPGTILHLF